MPVPTKAVSGIESFWDILGNYSHAPKPRDEYPDLSEWLTGTPEHTFTSTVSMAESTLSAAEVMEKMRLIERSIKESAAKEDWGFADSDASQHEAEGAVPDNIAEIVERTVRAEPGLFNFDLAGPHMITVKDRKGGYKKLSVPGDSSFQLSAAYKGKRHKAIFVFKPQFVTDWAVMEMDLNQACDHLIGFKAFISEVLTPDFKASKKKAVETQQEPSPHEAPVEVRDQVYGSW